MLIVKDIHYAKPLSEAIVFILVYLVICCILTFPSEYLILNKIEIFYDIISIYNSKNIFKRERERASVTWLDSSKRLSSPGPQSGKNSKQVNILFL